MTCSLIDPKEIEWDSLEKAWIHSLFEMRYDPAKHDFYMFVSEIISESRRLHYSIPGEDLVLSMDGSHGARNREILGDLSWDMNYIYIGRIVLDTARKLLPILQITYMLLA